MHVRVRRTGFPECIVIAVYKLTKIEEFRNFVKEKFHVEPDTQLLFHDGKLLEDGYTFQDYKIKPNDLITLKEKTKPSALRSSSSTSPEEAQDKKRKEYEETISKFYKVGDFVDVKDRQLGSWEEGVITSIVIDQTDAIGSNNVTDDSYILYKTKLVYNDTLDEIFCKLSEIRPRARTVIEVQDLQAGQIVMINHNIDEPKEVGAWYDFKVEDVTRMAKYPKMFGELLLGPQSVSSNAIVRVIDKIFAIEEPVPLSQRSAKYNKLIATLPPKRLRPVKCRDCRDVSDAPCKHCGCRICAGKDSREKIVLCDECKGGFHIGCLTPPLDAVPDDDWYCPSCKRNPDEVIAPGGSKQTRTTSTNKSPDLGHRLACIGKTKSTGIPMDHFGPIPGIEVGMRWRNRMQLSEIGLHRPSVPWIHGRDLVGVFSIVLRGGYEDDEDNGNEFTYTGSGQRARTRNKRKQKQLRNQKFNRENRALARNCTAAEVSENGGDAGDKWQEGKPVRVMRSCKMLKSSPNYAPPKGIRYDGIYKVVKYYPETGRSGFRVFKYLLRRDDPSPAPWDPKAKKYDIVYPDGDLDSSQMRTLSNKNQKTKSKNNNSSALQQSEKENNEEASSSGTRKTKPKKKVEYRRTRSRRRNTSDNSLSPIYSNEESKVTSSKEYSPKNDTRTPYDNKALADSRKSRAQGKRKQKIILSKCKKSRNSLPSTSKKPKKTKGSKVRAEDSTDFEKSGSGTSTSKGENNNSSAFEQSEKENNGEASSMGTKQTAEKVKNRRKRSRRRNLASRNSSDNSLSPIRSIEESNVTSSKKSSPKNDTRTPDDNKALSGSRKSRAQVKRKQKIILSKCKKSRNSLPSTSKKPKNTKGSKVRAEDSTDSEKSGSATSTSKGENNNSSAFEQSEKENNGEASSRGTKQTAEKVKNRRKRSRRRNLASRNSSDNSLSPIRSIEESNVTSSKESSPKNDTRTPDDDKALAGSRKSRAQVKRKQKIILSKCKKSRNSLPSTSKKPKKTKGSKVRAEDSTDSEKSGSGTSKSPADTMTLKKLNVGKKVNKLSPTLMKLIESDKLNRNLWKELLDIRERTTLKKFEKSVLETFRCLACKAVVISPVTTPCKHNFCLDCLERALHSKKSKSCPCCRESLDNFKLKMNKKLQHALCMILPKYI